jgi:mannose-1-phosphate guanylyltransferase
VIVQNGDVLSAHDIEEQLRVHREAGAVATLHLVIVDDARAYGCVPTDSSGRVLAFHEKMPEPVSNQVNAGCYVLAREVITGIPEHTVVSVERETFPALLAGGAPLAGYVENAYWLDVGTPAAYVRASADLVRGAVTSPAYRVAEPGRCVDPTATVDDTATVSDGSAVGPGVTVHAGATVAASVVARAATIGAGAVVTRSAIGAAAVIGAGCVVTDAVVGDAAHIGAGNELIAGVRVWPQVVVPDGAVRFSSDA